MKTSHPLQLDKTADSSLQKAINKSIIFYSVLEKGPTFRSEIARSLNISSPVVSRVIQELIDERYLVETEKISTRSGKRPTQLSVNADRGLIVAIDLQKKHARIAVTDFAGNLLNQSIGFMPRDTMEIEGLIALEIDNILKTIGEKNGRELEAISIGVPAIVDTKQGSLISGALFKSLEGVKLPMALRERYQKPVFVENIAKLSVIGEKTCGQARAFDNVVFVEISSGVGIGILIEDRLVRGSRGAAGEIGSMLFHGDDLGFRRTNKGYLEQNASVESLVERAIAEIGRGRKTTIMELVRNDISKIDAGVVCQSASEGDELASDVIGQVVQLLSVAVINCVLVLNPDIVILGGDFYSLPEVEKLFVRPVRENIQRILPFEAPKLCLTRLGEDAGIIGASRMAIQALLTGRFPYALGL
jgi:glucokinase